MSNKPTSEVTTETSFSLIITQPEFLRTVRSILLDKGHFAVGKVRRRRTNRGVELIVSDWTVADAAPNGLAMSPMLDWCVMATDFDHTLPPESLVEVVQPRQSHRLIAISLNPDDYSSLSAVVSDEGTLWAPEQIRFIGHGLLTLPTSSLSTAEDDAIGQALRSSRTTGALGALAERLNHLNIAVVGAGRGGQELTRQLVASGVRRFTIIDGDTIQPENLDAMPMTSVDDIGTNKAVQLASTLRRNQPNLTVHCVSHSVTSHDGVRVLRETRFDTVFGFVDNNVARLAISRLCQETHTVYVDVGTLIERDDQQRTMSADVRLLEPKRGCVACVPQMHNLQDVLYALAAPDGTLTRGPRRSWSEERAGSLLHLNALACSMALEVWFRWLNSDIRTSHWLRICWLADGLPEFHEVSVEAADDCRFCQGVGHV